MKKALKFNVSKKLGQLMKVIQLFECQVQDRQYQLETLHKTYDPLIQECLENYSHMATEIQNSLKDDEAEIAANISELYKNKYEKTVDVYKTFLSSAEKDMKEHEVTMNEKIADLKQQIKEILDSISTNQSKFDENAKNSKANLESGIKNRNDKFKKEVEAHDKESDAKIEKLKQETKAKIESIKMKHTQDLAELRKAETGKIEKNPKLIEKLKGLKKGNANLHAGNENLKANVKELLVSFNKLKTDFKHNSVNITRDIKIAASEKEKKINQLNQEVQKNTSETDIILKDLEKKFIEDKDKYESELNELRKSMQAELESLKKEFSSKSELIRNQFDSFDDAIKDLTETHKREIEMIRKRHEEAANAAGIKQNQKHKEIIAVGDSNLLELKQMNEKKASVEMEQKSKIEELMKKFETDFDIENKSFQNIINEMKSKLNQSLEGGSSENAKLKKVLDDIRSQITKTNEENQNKENSYIEETDNIKNSANTENNNNLNQAKEENQNKFNNIKKNGDDNFAEMNNNQNEEYESEKNKLEKAYTDAIEKVNLEESANTEESDLERDYSAKLEAAKASYESVGEVKMDNSKIESLDKQIKELKDKLNQTYDASDQEKQQIIAKWQNQINEEASRHESTIDNNPESNDKSNQLEDIRAQIEKEKQHKDSEISNIKLEIENEKAQHVSKYETLKEKLKQAENRTDIESLEEHLKEFNNNLNASVSNYESIIDSEAKKAKFDQEKEEKDFQKEKEDILSQLKNVEEDAEKRISKIKSNSAGDDKQFADAIAAAKVKVTDSLKKCTENHIREVELLTRSFEQAKAELESDGKSFQSKYTSNASINDSNIVELQRTRSAEIEHMKNDWKGMLEFYEEKIAVLIKKRNEARTNFAKQPPRQSEVDLIERLQGQLQLITTQLQNAAKELTEYRAMLVSKEKEYNKRFGKNPKVGVLSTGLNH